MPLVHSPLITTRNLVLNYDFANIKSYPGTGSTVLSNWSPGITAGSLANTPTFSTKHNGIMTFDGVNEYGTFDIGSSNLTEPMSMEIWAYIKDDNVKMLCSWGDYAIFTITSVGIGYNTANSDIWGFNPGSYLNKWNHFIFEMRSNVSYSNNKIYYNGVSQTLSQIYGTGENVSVRTFNNGLGRLACRTPTAENLFMPVDIACFRIYRGALTQAEVSQNYNAHRGRFGL